MVTMNVAAKVVTWVASVDTPPCISVHITIQILLLVCCYNIRAPNWHGSCHFNDRLLIHVAVARGRSNVLRELCCARARSDSVARSKDRLNKMEDRVVVAPPIEVVALTKMLRPNQVLGMWSYSSSRPGRLCIDTWCCCTIAGGSFDATSSTNRSWSSDNRPATYIEYVSSQFLRSMKPTQPDLSSKPWNFLS